MSFEKTSSGAKSLQCICSVLCTPLCGLVYHLLLECKTQWFTPVASRNFPQQTSATSPHPEVARKWGPGARLANEPSGTKGRGYKRQRVQKAVLLHFQTLLSDYAVKFRFRIKLRLDFTWDHILSLPPFPSLFCLPTKRVLLRAHVSSNGDVLDYVLFP